MCKNFLPIPPPDLDESFCGVMPPWVLGKRCRKFRAVLIEIRRHYASRCSFWKHSLFISKKLLDQCARALPGQSHVGPFFAPGTADIPRKKTSFTQWLATLWKSRPTKDRPDFAITAKLCGSFASAETGTRGPQKTGRGSKGDGRSVRPPTGGHRWVPSSSGRWS